MYTAMSPIITTPIVMVAPWRVTSCRFKINGLAILYIKIYQENQFLDRHIEKLDVKGYRNEIKTVTRIPKYKNNV